MKVFTVKVGTSTGKLVYQALAHSSSACIQHAFEQHSGALGVTAIRTF